jgi:hypothetical protein
MAKSTTPKGGGKGGKGGSSPKGGPKTPKGKTIPRQPN